MSNLKLFKSFSITRFLEEIDRDNYLWFVKRLSGNDTGLTGSHQVGLYLPKRFVEKAFPEICTIKRYNPDFFLNECYFPNEDLSVEKVRAIYYNSKYFPERGLKKKYNEFRLTRWGGSNNPIQDTENTGSICILAVSRKHLKAFAVAWIATSVEEENIIESWLGKEVEPSRFILQPSENLQMQNRKLELQLPVEWKKYFPTGGEIFQLIIRRIPSNKWNASVDELLLKRRELEFQIFEIVEKNKVLPEIKNGFNSVETFIKYAHSISNRRKSRSGTSLELNIKAIFIDKKIAFSANVVTENKKKPDFLFPSAKAYHDSSFPSGNLNMLASKTCCKDRWRQIINEANRIKKKYLFTLQQGVSKNQLKEMKDNNIQLVVPQPFLNTFPKEWRKSLLTLGDFVEFIRNRQKNIKDITRWIS